MELSLMVTAQTGSSLGELAERSWDRFGAESATVFEGRRITSADLGAQARRVAGGLAGLGIGPGERVVVCMANCPEVAVSYHALWRIGAVVTPVLFLLSHDELRHVLADSGAAAVITTPEFAPKVLAAASDVPTVRAVVVAGGTDAGTGVVDFAELDLGPEAPLARVDPGRQAALLYTGGTTGRSKGVMLSHDAMSAAAWSAVSSGEPGMNVSLVPLPLAHAYGLLVATMSVHAVEPSTMVLMRWFEPGAWLALAAEHGVQVAATVPAMLRALLLQPLEDSDLSAMRRMVSGSAPLAAEVHAQLAERLPWVEIVEGYGCTETAAVVSSTPFGQARTGSVGRPAEGVEVKIVTPDGDAAPAGHDGEICVRGPSIMSGYWNSPEETASALRDGWFHTGDIGRQDADGYLYIVDRIKDLIIRGGFNVYPRDVEEVLISHPGIANAAVIGRPDDEHGEEVVAFVQPMPGTELDADEVRAYARERLSAVKYPREIRVVDDLPLTSIGKLDRKALRAGLV